MELYELGIKAAREGLAKGEFSSIELTQAIIDRYHAKNAEIGAYLTFDEEQALELARANPGYTQYTSKFGELSSGHRTGRGHCPICEVNMCAFQCMYFKNV